MKLVIIFPQLNYTTSLSSRRAWIETQSWAYTFYEAWPSLSSRRAWIETHHATDPISGRLCRSPHGERGLKQTVQKILLQPLSRSPHGERGLKLYVYHRNNYRNSVALLTESVD